MRNLTWFWMCFVLLACSDIAPVETVDLCKGQNPPSNQCAQCKTAPYAAGCPKCKHNPPDAKCENAVGGGGGGRSGMPDGGGGVSGNGLQDGGSGGAVAIDAGPDAMTDSGPTCGPCEPGWTLCAAAGVCAQCLKDGDCGGATPRCDKDASHACVQCVNDAQCAAAGMVCDEGMHRCVPCVLDGDCKDPQLPECKAHVCAPCTSQSACTGRDGFGSCDTATGSATHGECVQCLAHTDCKNPTPQCNSKRECVACTVNDEACVGRDRSPVCDVDDWSDTKGTCVECTGAKYGKCKVGNTEYVCDSAKRKCSMSHKKGMTGDCSPCVSDAECLNESRCAVQAYGSSALGPYCFPVGGGSPGCATMTSPARRPYSQSKPLVSVDHQGDDYCLPITTCQAVQDATDKKDCAGNTQCGEPDTTDGICIDSGPAMGKCSYVCQTDWDCPGSVGGFTSCGTGFVCQP